jgi:hypothetical protein
MNSRKPFTPPLFCLVCGVDSGPVLKFFAFVVGAGLIGTICLLTWGYATGKFRFSNEPAQIPLDAENFGGVSRD